MDQKGISATVVAKSNHNSFPGLFLSFTPYFLKSCINMLSWMDKAKGSINVESSLSHTGAGLHPERSGRKLEAKQGKRTYEYVRGVKI